MNAIAVLSLIAVSSLNQGPWLDGVISQNPVNRLMAAGTVTIDSSHYGTTAWGVDYSYGRHTTVCYKEERSLMQSWITDGTVPIPPDREGRMPDPNVNATAGKYIMVASEAGSYVANGGGLTATRFPRDRYPKAFSPIGVALLTDRIIEALRAGQGQIEEKGITLEIDGGKIRIRLDESGRVAELAESKSGYECVTSYSDYTAVGGKSVPGTIQVVKRFGGRTELLEMGLRYEPGEPTNEELAPILPSGVRIATADPTGRRSQTPARTSTAVGHPTKLDYHPWSACIQTDAPYPTYVIYCCGTSDCAWQNIEVRYGHGHCYYFGPPAPGCDSGTLVVIVITPCQWHPGWPSPWWCDEPCWNDTWMDEIWESNVCDFWTG